MRLLKKLNYLLTILRRLDLDHHTDIISHGMGTRTLKVESLIVPDIEPTSRDINIADRLLKAYKRSIENERSHKDVQQADLWSNIKMMQPTFLEVLHKGSPDSLAAYLCNMSRHDATIGTVQGNIEHQRIQHKPNYRDFVALMIKDKLVSLAEAVGAISCENPEQGRWGENLHMSVDFLVEQVERVVGMDISPPPIDGGLLKIRSSRGLFHERDLNAIYTAWILKDILPAVSSAAVCEIGAGSGRVAYWSWRYGFRSYTIYDLPHINVVQGFYLLKSLPDIPISLFGEQNAENTTQGMAIQPYYMIHSERSGKFDLILNQDSFPEINANTVRAYLERIKLLSRQFFLSINHESRPPSIGNELQLNVQDIIDSVGDYRRLLRAPYWLRRGYVAELYAICGKESGENIRPGSRPSRPVGESVI
jgi:hypothetical protein